MSAKTDFFIQDATITIENQLFFLSDDLYNLKKWHLDSSTSNSNYMLVQSKFNTLDSLKADNILSNLDQRLGLIIKRLIIKQYQSDFNKCKSPEGILNFGNNASTKFHQKIGYEFVDILADYF